MKTLIEIKEILSSIIDIENFTREMDFNSFKKDKKTIYAVVRCLEIMVEASQKISRTVKEKYPAVPWLQISSMQNKLIHENSSVDVNILWQTIREDVPYLKSALQKIASNSGLLPLESQ
jgi:uncharacterized protein with HEPN domain